MLLTCDEELRASKLPRSVRLLDVPLLLALRRLVDDLQALGLDAERAERRGRGHARVRLAELEGRRHLCVLCVVGACMGCPPVEDSAAPVEEGRRQNGVALSLGRIGMGRPPTPVEEGPPWRVPARPRACAAWSGMTAQRPFMSSAVVGSQAGPSTRPMRPS